jgi:hypothetical protein
MDKRHLAIVNAISALDNHSSHPLLTENVTLENSSKENPKHFVDDGPYFA